jgi:hypothetical protein
MSSRWRPDHGLTPGVERAISNTDLFDLVFLVVASPVMDDERPM